MVIYWCRQANAKFGYSVFLVTKEKEPEIYNAVRTGALVENTEFFEGTHEINFDDSSITENTRVSYP